MAQLCPVLHLTEFHAGRREYTFGMYNGGSCRFNPEVRRAVKVPAVSIKYYHEHQLQSKVSEESARVDVTVTRLIFLNDSSMDVLESLEEVEKMF